MARRLDDLLRFSPEEIRRAQDAIERQLRDAVLNEQLRLLLGPLPGQPRPAPPRRDPHPDAIEAEYVEHSNAPTPLLPAKVGDAAGEL